MDKLELLKANLIRTAQHHRKTCEGSTCNIMLWLLLEVGQLAGIQFTEEETREFI